jgi:hypothetical protein
VIGGDALLLAATPGRNQGRTLCSDDRDNRERRPVDALQRLTRLGRLSTFGIIVALESRSHRLMAESADECSRSVAGLWPAIGVGPHAKRMALWFAIAAANRLH